MAPRLRLNGLPAPGAAWLGVALVLAAGALGAWWAPAWALDWQPARAAAQPWRAVSAAWVHWSALHLAANLVGAAGVAALGWTARLPWPAALAWAVAWPLTHLSLLLQPALVHYGGASGVLHAGAAVAAVVLLWHEAGRRRAVGGAIAVAVVLKVLLERPWAGPLRHEAPWDIAIAPMAHAAGAFWGLLLGALAAALSGRGPNGARVQPTP